MDQYLVEDLLQALPTDSYTFHGQQQSIIEHITWDFKAVVPNTMYFCLEDEEFQEDHIQTNSLDHWKDAVAKGATCILASKGKLTKVPGGVSLIEVENVNFAMGLVSKIFYQDPFKDIKVIGITGTNGKTTTSQFIDAILQESNIKTGVIGTIGIFSPEGQQEPGILSTPLATELYANTDRMIKAKAEVLILEVTSQSMSYHRTNTVDFDVAVFMNLTQDHLDHHKSIEAYKAAKLSHFARLGSLGKNSFGVINLDDHSGIDFLNIIPKEHLRSGKVQTITFGIVNKDADLVAYPKEMTGGGSEVELIFKGDSLGVVHLPMPGLFNIYNALASFAVTFSLGIPIQHIIEGLKKIGQVTGRFEKVQIPNQKDVYVDYAHTPDSLKNILETLRLLTKGQLIVVFGCGGDRDRGKRPLMGKIASDFADLCVITSDNPRSENPTKIVKDIINGIPKASLHKTVKELDRKKAIHYALAHLEEFDTLLIAGKGHETYQIVGKKRSFFSDRIVVEEYYSAEKAFSRAWIEVSVSQLEDNWSIINKDKPKNLKIMAVVKDNGLGHGIELMARQAIKVGCTYLGVACLSEALTLRKSGINDSILIFGERLDHEIFSCLQNQLTIQIQSLDTAKKIANEAKKQKKVAKVHLKVDTGMGRYGVPYKKTIELFNSLLKLKWIEVEGIMTHFAQSDESKKDYANLQWNRFQQILTELKSKKQLPKFVHSCNTGGYLDLPQAHGNLVRLGILPLGVYPSKVCRRIVQDGQKLKPVMSVKTVIAFLKEVVSGDSIGYGMHYTAKKKMKVAVLPIGYGDGYPRLRNKGYVLIGGEKAPILGGNAMDATMVDVTHIDTVKPNDHVVLLGKQNQKEITAMMLADWAGTVCYQILSQWSSRMDYREVTTI